jgi:hypothetical protein
MACINISGYNDVCDESYGGIKKVAIFEHKGLKFSDATITSGQITELDLEDGYSGYTYDFLKDNSNFTDADIGDGILASVASQPTITLMFRKWSQTLRNEVEELKKGYLAVIIQDRNDNYWCFGKDEGLQVVAGTGAQSGNLHEDLNGYTLTIQGKEKAKAYGIDIGATSDVDDKILALFGF